MAFNLQEYQALKHPLRFKKDGTFRILMLSDIHGGVAIHPQLMPAMHAVVEAAKPDLVLLAGDTNSHRIGAATPAQLRDFLSVITAPMEQNGIPWAHVYGNHDDNMGISNEDQQPVYEAFPYCLSKRGPRDISGVGNYVLPILCADSDEPAFNIWAMDSNNNNRRFARKYGLPEDLQVLLPNHFTSADHDYDAPHADQILWYYEASRAIEQQYGRKIPGMLYMHMPLPEFCLIPMNPGLCRMRGNMRESIGCDELNTGLFATCLQRGDVKAIFVGHDHINDFTGEYCGITMGYCAGMSYDIYCDDDMRGGRVIDLKESDPLHAATFMLRIRDLMGPAGDKRVSVPKQP